MKLLHTADWHLGKALYGRSLLEEQRWFLQDWLLPLVEREKPDAVLLAGDIFDRQVPPVEAVELLDGFLNRLSELKVPLVAVSGNHDSARRLSLGAGLLRRQGVVLATHPHDIWSPYTIDTADGPLCCWTLTYCDPAAAREALQQPENGPRYSHVQMPATYWSHTASPPAGRWVPAKAPPLWAAAAKWDWTASKNSTIPRWGTCTAHRKQGKAATPVPP